MDAESWQAPTGSFHPEEGKRVSSGFILRQLRDMIITLLLMSCFVFLIFYIIPGDPVTMILGTHASADRREALAHELNLDKPPLLAYKDSLVGLFSLEHPAQSIRFRQPVRSFMAPRLALTLRLAALAFALILFLAVPLAILCARFPHSFLDRFLSYLAEIFMAVPGFFLGILLVILFSLVLGQGSWARFVPLEAGTGAHLQSLILPALALALPQIGRAQQFYRTALLATRQEDYVRTAEAKGASPARVIYFHMIRNSLLPLVTSLGVILAELITGSLVVEQVFGLPGAGKLLLSAILARDLPLAQGLILAIAGLVIVINTLVDLINAFIDPRLQLTNRTTR